MLRHPRADDGGEDEEVAEHQKGGSDGQIVLEDAQHGSGRGPPPSSARNHSRVNRDR